MSQLSAEVLLNLGFRDIAKWIIAADGSSINYILDSANAKAQGAMLDVRNALYAFVHDDKVNYIGKTSRSIRKRFTGYRNPGKTQPTNQRCHDNIKASLRHDIEIRIFAFTPISDLRYGEFQIDLAAGLEEALIVAFSPPWNDRDGQRLVTEEAEREATEEAEAAQQAVLNQSLEAPSETEHLTNAPTVPKKRQAAFQIKLGKAYYNLGLINPGAEASQFLGEHDDAIVVYLGSDSEQVDSLINRTANANGSVRIVGNNRLIADWFQRHFEPGDVVEAQVKDPQHILLSLPAARVGK